MPFAWGAFQNFTLIVNCSPKVVPFPVDLHENLIKLPLPIRMTAPLVVSFLHNLWCKHWPEAVPLKPNCFMAYIDTLLMKKVSYIEWSESGNRTFSINASWMIYELVLIKMAGWRVFCHFPTLKIHPIEFNSTLPVDANRKSLLYWVIRASYVS